jgi:hypothetical protein
MANQLRGLLKLFGLRMGTARTTGGGRNVWLPFMLSAQI